MKLIETIKEKLASHHQSCGCGQQDSTAGATTITKDMIVRDVTKRWPQTVSVFGNHKVDFCCGGTHTIGQTARARGCRDIDALVADLNVVIESRRRA